MNEEMKNEVMETENEVEVIDAYDEAETSDGVNKLAVAGAVLAGAAALGAIAWKKGKGKLRAWQIKKLEKDGYTVYGPDAAEEVSYEDISEENVSEE